MADYELTDEDRKRLADALTPQDKEALLHADGLAEYMQSMDLDLFTIPVRLGRAEFEIVVRRKL